MQWIPSASQAPSQNATAACWVNQAPPDRRLRWGRPGESSPPHSRRPSSGLSPSPRPVESSHGAVRMEPWASGIRSPAATDGPPPPRAGRSSASRAHRMASGWLPPTRRDGSRCWKATRARSTGSSPRTAASGQSRSPRAALSSPAGPRTAPFACGILPPGISSRRSSFPRRCSTSRSALTVRAWPWRQPTAGSISWTAPRAPACSASGCVSNRWPPCGTRQAPSCSPAPLTTAAPGCCTFLRRLNRQAFLIPAGSSRLPSRPTPERSPRHAPTEPSGSGASCQKELPS